MEHGGSIFGVNLQFAVGLPFDPNPSANFVGILERGV